MKSLSQTIDPARLLVVVTTLAVCVSCAHGDRANWGKGIARVAPMFTGVGALPSGPYESIAEDVSADGPTVVGSSGYYEFVENGQPQHIQGKPFRWTPTTGMVELQSFKIDHVGGAALAISENADIIVGYGYIRWDTPSELGFEGSLWAAPAQTLETLVPLNGYTYARAVGYSEDRELVAGYSQLTGAGSPPSERACVWSRWGPPIGLSENAPGAVASHSQATAISKTGTSVVGFGWQVEGSDTFIRPCIWQSSPTGVASIPPGPSPNPIGTTWLFGFTQSFLPLLDGTTEGLALDISDQGEVIVGHCSRPDHFTIPCKWERDRHLGTYTAHPITPLPDANTGTATAVAGDGQVIVGYTSGLVGEDYIVKGWIWSQTNSTRVLADALSAEGLSQALQGWSQLEPHGISADGTVVVGRGAHEGKPDYEGWVGRLSNP